LLRLFQARIEKSREIYLFSQGTEAMSNKLKQAISLIKSGQKQKGRQLLSEILNAEPDNELAWLWMSAAVSKDKRRYCLEKVLSINPHNQQAQQALAKVAQAEAKAAAPPPAPSPAPAKPSSPGAIIAPVTAGGDLDPSKPELWINQEGKLVYIMALLKNELVSATIDPGTAKKFQAELRQGRFPLDMLANKKVAPFNQITEVSQTMSTVRVHYRQANAAKSTRLEGKDDEMAEAIVNALEKRLGSRFERTSRPMGRGKISAISLIVMLILLGGNIFCYFGALEASSGAITPTRGSAQTRGIVALLGLLGPNGVVCIGSILLLLALVSIIYYLVNPPLVTKLIPATTGSAK
jgi:flagellar basal body-associated protein FliL